MWRMRKKSLSVLRDYGNFIMVLYIQIRLRMYAKSIEACMEHTLKSINVFREYANRHKSQPISANFRPNPEQNCDPKSPYWA
jgi:hypothetical protein